MINPISNQRKERLKIYAKLKRRFFKENPVCCVPGCGEKTEDLHHRNGRIGILLIVVELWRSLCRVHHNRLKEPGGVEWGRSLDLLPPPGGHNTIPPELRAKYR